MTEIMWTGLEFLNGCFLLKDNDCAHFLVRALIN